ncbi:MAG: hypothetical protein HGA72_09900, partial [Chlorobiaceae bacterium]|nr:hypothetical protein [Chlorobiaceae bacterium]
GSARRRCSARSACSSVWRSCTRRSRDRLRRGRHRKRRDGGVLQPDRRLQGGSQGVEERRVGHAVWPGEEGAVALGHEPQDAPLAAQIFHELGEDYYGILAGGLNADNAAKAVSSTRPWAVDTASGVESAPGIKSAEKIHHFIQAVRNAAQQD